MASKKDLMSAELLRQIRVQRYQNGEVAKLLRLLENANKYCKEQILKTNTIDTKARYNELSVQINSIARELRDNIRDGLDNTDLIDSEIDAQSKIFRDNGMTVHNTPNSNTIRTAVQFEPFADNSNFESFLNSVNANFYDTWDNALRVGYMTGETTKKIVQNVMGSVAKDAQLAKVGSIQRLRDSIERNTRTYLQAMATVSRERVFANNAEYFKGYQWLATLDNRTCLVCGKLDGAIKKDIADFPQPPMHYNCRCVILPVVKGMDDYEDTRASMSGQVADSVDYESWLSAQPASIQREVLGNTRYEMYIKTGKIGMFVQDNAILSIKELRKMYE